MKTRIKNCIKNNKLLTNILLPLIRTRSAYINRNKIGYEYMFSNIKEGSLVVSVNNIPGRFEIDARSHILRTILLSKEYEHEVVNLVKKYIFPDRDIINAGANIGLFTCLTASLINSNQKVLSIEPVPNVFKYLKSNIKRNGHVDKIITYNGIAAEQPGTFKINFIEGKEEYSSIGKIVFPAVSNEKYKIIDVMGETIDRLVDLHNLNPGFLLVDVEGAEHSVLRGAKETLKKYKPIILSELVDDFLVEQKSNSNKVIMLLKDSGYKVTDISNKTISFPYTGTIIAIPLNS